MPFLTTDFNVSLLNDREKFPFLTLNPWEYYSPLTGDTYTIRKYFRTDGASIPVAITAFPVLGQLLVMRFFGRGVFQGFKQGVLHDFLRREDREGKTLVPASVAHKVFREALYDAGYPSDLCETYYAAVVAFNSSE